MDSLRERLAGQRFQLAVLGQFKRGKSTFINALLGAPLLPIAVVPLTAVPVFVSWGSSPIARIHFAGDRPDEELSAANPDDIRQFLFRFVSEEANPKNELGVERVDLSCPAPILANGVVLIDTPGVGSTFRHNTEAALRVLPECDATLFVISVDPPITEVEIEYLKQIKAKVSKLDFILNKADYLRPKERERVAEFIKRSLEQHDLWSPDTTIFSVSAAEGLDAKQCGDQAELKSSGIPDVERYLASNLVAQKSRLLEQAVRSKTADIASEAIAEIRLHIRALEMPLEALASKCQVFEQTLGSIEVQRRIIRDLLEGERRRLRNQLEERIELLRKNAMTTLSSIIDPKMLESKDFQYLGRAMTEVFDKAGQEFVSSFVAAINSTLNEHQRRIHLLIDEVRSTAGELFHTPFPAGFELPSFSLGEDPYWITETIETTLLPDGSALVDHIVPAPVRHRRRRARILRQVGELILRNAENLRWAILRGIDETFRKAGAAFEEHLDEAITATNGIVKQTLEKRTADSLAVDDDLEHLQMKSEILGELRERLRPEHDDRIRDTEEVK
jgi:GTPase Era involved in 16S rRNA processing